MPKAAKARMTATIMGCGFVTIIMGAAAIVAVLELTRNEVPFMSSPYAWLIASGTCLLTMFVVCYIMYKSMPHLTDSAAGGSLTGSAYDLSKAMDAASIGARPAYEAVQQTMFSVAIVVLLVGIFLWRFDDQSLSEFNDRYDIDYTDPGNAAETFIVGEWQLWNVIMVFVIYCCATNVYAISRAFYGGTAGAMRELMAQRSR